jgi:ribonuclease VapC
MVIDSSIWVAIVLGEPDAQDYVRVIDSAIAKAETLYIPASVIAEAGVVLDRRGHGEQFNTLLNSLRPNVIAINREVAETARRAYQTYGRAAHKAGLNFGDCLVYAACAQLNEVLLFRGDDFVHTDVRQYPIHQ